MHREFTVLAVLPLTFAATLAHGLPNLCTPAEQVVWSCTARQKVFSLCASRDLSATVGYLQYRAGSQAHQELVFPAGLQHPKGVFWFSLLPRGVSVAFENKGYRYLVHEPLSGPTTIDVRSGQRGVASIECGESSDTLTLTETINQFTAVGAFGQPN